MSLSELIVESLQGVITKKKKKDYGFKHKFAIKGCRPLKEKEWWSN